MRTWGRVGPQPCLLRLRLGIDCTAGALERTVSKCAGVLSRPVLPRSVAILARDERVQARLISCKSRGDADKLFRYCGTGARLVVGRGVETGRTRNTSAHNSGESDRHGYPRRLLPSSTFPE